MRGIMFSPVYEHKWESKHWDIWKDQCLKVVDLITEFNNKGIRIDIEHFNSYCRNDGSKWPCGAGRFYVGFDTDGSLWPCHRFIKFGDNRPWWEKEMVIGHVDKGIINHKLRRQFIDFKPECGDCKYYDTTPCHGGCFGINFDLTGKINIPYPDLCKYVAMQNEISLILKSKIGDRRGLGRKSCICNNLIYINDDGEEISNVDGSDTQCHCDNANYGGNPDTLKVTKPLRKVIINPLEVLKRLEQLEKRVYDLENSKGE
jgi:radical SAM protein with 4Fe4S-binding SPASM domain